MGMRERLQRLLDDDDALVNLRWSAALPGFGVVFYGLSVWDAHLLGETARTGLVVPLVLSVVWLAGYVGLYWYVRRHRR